VIGTASLLTVTLITFILCTCCHKKSISKGQHSTDLQGVENTAIYMDLMNDGKTGAQDHVYAAMNERNISSL